MKSKPKVNPQIQLAIIVDYLSSGATLCEMEKKYGHSAATVGAWVEQYKDLPDIQENVRKARENAAPPKGEKAQSQDVKELQEKLRLANLKTELLEAILDIGKEQYGIDLRKNG